MYKVLGTVQIKSGERMEIGVIHAPDGERRERLSEFLIHKGPDWVPQVEAALAGPLDSMLSLFFVGQIGGRLVCHTVVSGDRRVGILGHVYTRPEDRRKGAIKALLDYLLAYCTPRYDVLSLMTGFDTAPYWIYHELGFRGVTPSSDEMLWQNSSKSLPFEAGSASVRPLEWGDWGFLNMMAFQADDGSQVPRSPLLGLKGAGHVEDTFIKFQMQRDSNSTIQANALVSSKGTTVGWALLAPDTHWFGDVLELDIYAHPNFIADLPQLAASIELPSTTVFSYLTDPEGTRAEALCDIGFRHTAQIPGCLNADGYRDLYIMEHSEKRS